MHSIAVVGIGNSLLQDDGVGIHALQYFESHHADAGVSCLDAGTVGLALMDRLSNLHGLVAVDAMRLGKAPGTVTVLEGAEMTGTCSIITAACTNSASPTFSMR